VQLTSCEDEPSGKYPRREKTMPQTEKQIEIETLADQISRADRAYYDNDGEVELTDEMYDSLKERLRELGPNHPLLKTVGATPKMGTWPKATHPIPMGSLSKVKGVDGIRDWFQKITTG
jgi:NAD-dependent DNA ligase